MGMKTTKTKTNSKGHDDRSLLFKKMWIQTTNGK
jgi:hypothetical protein